MPFDDLIPWIVVGLKGIAAVMFLFGVWSTKNPGRSIALYQAIMRAFNWRVEPIDQPRELATTRWLGVAISCCSLVIIFLLW
ncbi:MAG: hypothetical protein HYT88_01890 [Candidatus Omnitrophica bacterium]|nr:hypothetical protein [Candidatus Omnitrophota bacterium]MBI2173815.1 hypothetical protein [Candidatus Omnitrophota bacterium]MBI3009789.1 hypothetical protein [Candidatus Omnitrophota bacterium]